MLTFTLVALLGVVAGAASPAVAALRAHRQRPTLTAVPFDGRHSLAVRGHGFVPHSTGRVVVSGHRDGVRIATDRAGRFAATLRLRPAAAPGPVRLVARVHAGRGARVARLTVTGALPRLTWAPPALVSPLTLTISKPGSYDLLPGVDYRISAPARIDGAVQIRGGRNVVWIGGHIRIPAGGSALDQPALRRGLVISDPSSARTGPARTVHIEGLLIDGSDLDEGIDTNAPTAVVQLQNIRMGSPVHFRSSDDRDGRSSGAPGSLNHPDVIQIWGSQRELRVDGLTATSSYQGLFLKEDVPDAVHGHIWLRRIDVKAVTTTGADGVAYAGMRMFGWYAGSVGPIHLDPGTVRVAHSSKGGWVRSKPNPAPGSNTFWRTRYWSSTGGCQVLEPPPGSAVFTDTLGTAAPTLKGSDVNGTYAAWASGITDWTGTAPGRVYSGLTSTGSYVPSGAVGLGYVTPGYAGSTG